MLKRKVIQTALAVMLAASSITAVAPSDVSAASNATKAVKNAKAVMYNAYSSYYNAKSYVKVGTVKEKVRVAKIAYNKAKKEIQLSGGSKKRVLLADLKSSYKYISRAEGYVKGAHQAYLNNKNLKQQLKSLNAAAINQKPSLVKTKYNSLKKDVNDVEKRIKKSIYGTNAEKNVMKKYTSSIKKALAGDIKVYYYYEKADYWIKKGDPAKALERMNQVAILKSQIDPSTNLGKAVLEYTEKVTLAYEKIDQIAPTLIVSNLSKVVDKEQQILTVSTDDPTAKIFVTLNGTEVKKGASGYTLILKSGDNTIVVTATDKAGNKAEKIINVKLNAVQKIESIQSINSTKVEIKFINPLTQLIEILVNNKGTKQIQYVKSVSLSTDKKSATVEFYDTLVLNNNYTFTVNVDGKSLTYDYLYKGGDVAKIEITNQSVKPGSKLVYKALDVNGKDITNEVASNIQIVSQSNKISADGTVNLAPGTSANAKVVYTNPTTKAKIESANIKVTAVESEPSSIANYTIAKDEPSWNAPNYKQNTSISSDETNNNKKLFVQFVDQFGEKYQLAAEESIVYESLNTDVAVVDKKTGIITPMSTGNASVKLTVIRLVSGKEVILTSKTVGINVIVPSKATTLQLYTTNIIISTKDSVGIKVSGRLVDQYGKPFIGAKVDISINNNLASIPQLTTNKAGEFSFYIKPTTNVIGSYKLEAIYTKADGSQLKAPFSVNLVNPGTFYQYQVKGLENIIDKYIDSINNTMNISVVSVDNRGYVIKEESNPTIEVKDKDGKIVPGAVGPGDLIDPKNLVTDQTYTLIVSFAGKVIRNHSFKVVDTTEKTIASFKNDQMVIEKNVTPSLAQELEKILDVRLGDNVFSETITGLDFVSSDKSIINDDASNALNPGTTTIFIRSVTCSYTGVVSETFTFDKPVKITVTVK